LSIHPKSDVVHLPVAVGFSHNRRVAPYVRYSCGRFYLGNFVSTVSFAVAQRNNELGVRMALGAHIVWIVAKSTLATVIGGIFMGSLIELVASKVFQHWSPWSSLAFWVLACVTLLLFVSATLACLLPARHAAYIDPMRTLRNE
jgi:ABC-type antimicrobial peptide transport system permease subunit